MHAAQRLIGFIARDAEHLRPFGGAVVPIQGTRLHASLSVATNPGPESPIGYPGYETAMTLADLEVPEVVALLNEEGLGCVVRLVASRNHHDVCLSAQAPTAAHALTLLLQHVRDSWPDPEIVLTAARSSTTAWASGERREVEGYAITKPTASAGSRATVLWNRDEGDFTAEVVAAWSHMWARSVQRALATPLDAATHHTLRSGWDHHELTIVDPLDGSTHPLGG